MKYARYGMFGILFFVCTAHAAKSGDQLEINFTGHLYTSSPCTVNNDEIIKVEFGSVGVNKVESEQVSKTVPYSLDCGSAGAGSAVKMTVVASSTVVDKTAITSSAPGLWIKFLKDGQLQKLNESFSVSDWHNPPVIEVMLAKDPEQPLQAMQFTATATLVAEYL